MRFVLTKRIAAGINSGKEVKKLDIVRHMSSIHFAFLNSFFLGTRYALAVGAWLRTDIAGFWEK